MSFIIFEKLYKKYNKKEYIHPDPLEFVHNYKEFFDIEIVSFIASSFAYGRVSNILKIVKSILRSIDKPYKYITMSSEKKISNDFRNFKYRFTNSREIVNFFLSIQNIYKEFDSIYNCFSKIFIYNKRDIIKTLVDFTKHFKDCNSLIPDASKKSACKRLFLALRWLVRKDDVDLGIWEQINKKYLIIPLDTHMLNISQKINFTQRKNNDIKTAVEITEKFKKINSKDPIKYDFVLTRFGIREDLNINFLLKNLKRGE